MKEEIDPKLEKLREEKRAYLAYQKTTSELERLTRLVKAYEWTLSVEKAKKAGAEVKRKRELGEERRSDLKRFKGEVDGMEADAAEIGRRKEKVSLQSPWGGFKLKVNLMTHTGIGKRREAEGLARERE